MKAALLISLLTPAVAASFSLAFVVLWAMMLRRPYVLALAVALALFAAGLAVQILNWPTDVGINTVLSCVLYAASVSVLCTSLIARQHGRVRARDLAVMISGMVVVTALVAVYYYVDDRVAVRAYIMNLSFGAASIYTAVVLRFSRSQERVDRLLAVMLLLFGVHFFIRTTVSMSVADEFGAENPFSDSLFWAALMLSLGVFTVLLCATLFAVIAHDVVADLQRQSRLDPLTMLLNRRGLEHGIERLRMAGDMAPLAVIVGDIDWFKRVNDTYGHGVGDRVLRGFADVVRDSLRDGDLACRLGGEEVGILLPRTGAAQALSVAERIRSRFAAEQAVSGVGATASFGVTELRPGETLMEAFDRADACLYRAKAEGRNRSVADEGALVAAVAGDAETRTGAFSQFR